MKLKQRILSLALAGAMLCSLCPPALAAGEGNTATQTQVTAGAATSEDARPADGDSELPASAADDTADPAEGPGPAANGGLTGENTAPAAAPAVAAVQAQLDALPTAEELAALSLDAQRAVYDQVQAAYDAYTALTDEQKEQITGAEVFEDLFAVFNGMTTLAAEETGFTYTTDSNQTKTTTDATLSLIGQSEQSNKFTVTQGNGTSITSDRDLTLAGNITVTGDISTSGSNLTISSGNIVAGGKISSQVQLAISGGHVTVSSIAITGTLNGGTGYTLNITGGVVDVNSITLQNSGTGPATFTVNGNNAVVFADDVTVTAGGFASKNYQNGVVFEGTSGKVYGSVTLPDDVTIPEGYTLTIPSDASLTVPRGTTLTNKGTITVENGGTFTNSGAIENYGTINGTVDGTTPQTPATVSVTVTPATATYGTTVTLTANVTGGSGAVNSGTVTFYQGTDTTGTLLNSEAAKVTDGTATYELELTGTNWKPNTYTITAVYSGGTGLLGSTGTATLTVSKATPGATPVGPISSSNRSETSITLNTVSDGNTGTYGPIQYGYTMGSETTPGYWQDSTEFADLQPGTDYTFYIRYKGNDFYNPSSPGSNTLVVTTNPKITTESLSAGHVGVNYEAQLTASVANGKNVTWSIISGPLPAGLELNGDTIGGNPSVAGMSSITVQASIAGDMNGELQVTSTATLYITINQGTSVITADTYNNTTQTDTFSYGDTITVSGKIAASTTAPSASNGISLLAEPAQNQVGLYVSGNDNPIATAGVDSNGNFTLSYDTAGKGIIPGESSQTLTVKYGGSSDLNSGSTNVSITLNPKPVTAIVTNAPITKVYDGGTTATVTLGFDEGTILTGDTVTVSAPNAVYASAGVGDNIAINFGTLTVEGSDAGWYSVSAPTGITGSITAAASSVDTAPAAVSDLTYNGSAQNLVTAGTATGGNLMYALGTDADTAPTENYSETIPTGTDAGTYYVWYKVQGDDNHNDTDPVCVTASIAKAAVTVTANSYTKTYGESDPTFAYTVSESTPLMGSDSLTGLTLTREPGEDAGKYAITLTEAENANPNYAVTTVNGALTVKERDIADATVTLGEALIANGQAQTQTIDSVTVKLDNGKTEAVTYTVTGNTVTGAGAHTMTLTGTGNYTGELNYSFVVLPAAEDMTFDEDGTYTVKDGGTLAVHVDIAPGLPETTITTSYGELLASLVQNRQITTEDLAALANPSAHLRVVLQVKGEVSQDDRAKIQAALGDYTLGQYLDLTLQKVLTVNETTTTIPVTEPGIPLDICVTLPQSLINTDGGVARTYRVLRLHNGQVDALDARYADGKLTFATDRFSLYAIAYRDEAIPAQGGAAPAATATPAPAGPATVYYTCPACGFHNWTATAEGYRCDTCGHIVTAQLSGYGNVKGLYDPAAARASGSGSGAGVTAPVPQTGDESKPALWAVVCALSAAALLGLGVAKRKRQ